MEAKPTLSAGPCRGRVAGPTQGLPDDGDELQLPRKARVRKTV